MGNKQEKFEILIWKGEYNLIGIIETWWDNTIAILVLRDTVYLKGIDK